ncbi:hypothetical protein [Nocardia sp. NBC_01327]|uniref:hypothetical protein n=1 Tax=Nocardia sp. NBC_01327 TaxID=2903593 RepID=UPI002E0E94A7|nr:hypothetical protein OG326_28800 [Nocardia sp. NBC_01327]
MRLLTTVSIAAFGLMVAGCSSGDDSTPAPTTASTAVVGVKDCLSQPESHPKDITITCADADLSVAGIDWESWTGDSARGKGTQNRNTCEPSCATGTHESLPVTVELTDPVDGYFSRITVTATDLPAQTYPLPN